MVSDVCPYLYLGWPRVRGEGDKLKVSVPRYPSQDCSCHFVEAEKSQSCPFCGQVVPHLMLRDGTMITSLAVPRMLFCRRGRYEEHTPTAGMRDGQT